MIPDVSPKAAAPFAARRDGPLDSSLAAAAVRAPAATAGTLPQAGFSGLDAAAAAGSPPSHSLRESWATAEGRELRPSEELEDEPVALPASRNEDTEMDMTPMVDVTFLLLIFFMITAAFASEKVIQQQTTPKDSAQSTPLDIVDKLTIRVDELNSFLVMLPDLSEREAPSKQDLIVVLNESRKEGLLDDVENVTIEAHEESIHSATVAALDACAIEGLHNFQVKYVEEFE